MYAWTNDFRWLKHVTNEWSPGIIMRSERAISSTRDPKYFEIAAVWCVIYNPPLTVYHLNLTYFYHILLHCNSILLSYVVEKLINTLMRVFEVIAINELVHFTKVAEFAILVQNKTLETSYTKTGFIRESFHSVIHT